MSAPPQSLQSAEGRPLSHLTREELGTRWAETLRRARAEGQLRNAGRAANWLSLPAVRELMNEFRARELAQVMQRAFWSEVAQTFAWADDRVGWRH